MTKKVHILLFDLGRVIFDLDIDRAWASWSATSGVDQEILRERFEKTGDYPDYDPIFQGYERGDVSTDDYVSHFNQCVGTRLTVDEFLSGWNSIFLDPIDGMLPLLQAISDMQYPLYAFSNTNADHEVIWRDRYGDHVSYFHEIFMSHGIGLRKPEMEAFQSVVERLGVNPSEILFFDDLVANVDAAKEVGINAHQFTDSLAARDRIEAALGVTIR